MTVRCFMVHSTNRWIRNLRRYSRSDLAEGQRCNGYSYHNAHSELIDIVECQPDADGVYRGLSRSEAVRDFIADPRWPVKCDSCDYRFTDADERQIWTEHIYVDDAGKEHFLRKPVPGMMWYADWMGDWANGPDGHCLVVVCPNGREWMIDSRASNCTMPDDSGPFDQHHRCWVRHGTPPNITVDKNGRTCGAGAGSIQAGDYHGFLRDGCFT